MAFAPYFAKSAQAAAGILQGFDPSGFAEALLRFPVGIAWDKRATTVEGRATLDLVVDLLARLYPELRVAALDDDSRSLIDEVVRELRRINPHVQIQSGLEDAAAVVVVGETSLGHTSGDSSLIYAGSRGWEARLAFSNPAGSGNTDNVFGAGVAACLAAAAVFRRAFAPQLGQLREDNDLRVSVLDLCPASLDSTTREIAISTPLSQMVDIGELHLVGIGAIGHGAVWALRRISWIKGTLFLIDDDPFDDTNPQRYVETAFNEAGAKPLAASTRTWSSPTLIVQAVDKPWATHIAEFAAAKGDWRLDRVALALDNVHDRVMAQAALPRRIYNAWTRAENLGISRHDFLSGPCVSCLYLPTGKRPNDDELIAGAFGMTQRADIERVRVYLDSATPLDKNALDWIAERAHITPEARARLSDFEGEPIASLYSRGICGGLLLVAGFDGGNAPVDVPMAFQSALAGILLAAEVVIDAGTLRSATLPAITEINLLRPLGTVLSRPEVAAAGCMCQDDDYRSVFQQKYSPASP